MLAILLATVALAAANPDDYFSRLHCKPAVALRGEVKSCDGNDAYTMAATNCLKNFEDSAAQFQKSLAKATAIAGQQSAETDAKLKYSESIHAFDVMIATSERLNGEIQAYKGEIVLPDDLGPVEDRAMEITDFLRNNPCYHMSQDLLDQTADVMHLKGEELRLTKKIAEAQLRRAGDRASALEADSAGRGSGTTAHGVGVGAGALRGNASPSGSSITGVEQDKAKQKK